MATITGALRKLGIRASETVIDDAEMADGLEDLNDLGAANNLFPPMASVSDTVRIPRGLDGALKLVLAEKILPDYSDLQLTPVLAKSFSNAWDDIWRITNGTIEVNFPNTLPLGSGSDDSYYLWNDAFFKESEKPNF
jgi:hypothetical protein